MAHQRVYFLGRNGFGEAVFAAKVLENLYRLEGTPAQKHNNFYGIGFGDIVFVEEMQDALERGVLAVKQVALKSGLVHSCWHPCPGLLAEQDVQHLEAYLSNIAPAYAEILTNHQSTIPYEIELSCLPKQFVQIAAFLIEYGFMRVS